MKLRKEEINRKALHAITGSVVPALILYIPLYAPRFEWLPAWLTPHLYPAVLSALASVLITSVELMRFKVGGVQRFFYSLGGSALRPEEAKKMTGATYIVYSALGCSVLFVNNPSISFMVLSAFILGDAAAALVGQSLGKTRIGSKTLEGSMGCFVLCMALFFLVFPSVPRLLDPWHGVMHPLMAIIASLLITLLELFPLPLKKNVFINDNLIVPLVTGLVILALFPALH
jgi:dolichol kinase